MKITRFMSAVIVLLSITCIGMVYAEKVTITVWSPQDQWQESLDYYAEQLEKSSFASKYPDVEMKFVHIPYDGYEAKYLTAFAGGKGPDIFMGKPAYYAGAIGVAAEAPADLQQLWSESVVKVIQPFFQIDGEWYAYPVSADLGMMLFYNADHFKEAGLTEPPKTMEEMLEYAKKLTVVENGQVVRQGYGVRYEGAPVGLADKALPFIHSFGGRLYAPDASTATGYLNGPETVAGLTFLGELVTKHQVATLKLGKPVDTFAAGKTSMIFRESWLPGWMEKNAPDLNYAVAGMPEGPQGYPGLSVLFGWSWMVNNSGKHQDICWEWIRSVSDAGIDMDLAKLEGYQPVLEDNFKDPFVTERIDYVGTKVILDHPSGPYYDHPFINEIASAAGEAVQAIFYGADPQEALDEATEEVNRLLKKKP